MQSNRSIQRSAWVAVLGLLLLADSPVSADPITAITGYFRRSAVTSGSDLTVVLVVLGAVLGFTKGFMGVFAGGVLGLVVAILIANADTISTWAHSISLL
jgi:hypothetical protein